MFGLWDMFTSAAGQLFGSDEKSESDSAFSGFGTDEDAMFGGLGTDEGAIMKALAGTGAGMKANLAEEFSAKDMGGPSSWFGTDEEKISKLVSGGKIGSMLGGDDLAAGAGGKASKAGSAATSFGNKKPDLSLD